MEPFPEDVARFMYDNVESIDQLEILRVLGEDRAREWDPPALATAVQSELPAVRNHVSVLQSRGLLRVTALANGMTCRYGGSTPELERMISRLLQMYKERPVTMIKMVYERAKDPLRAFADAFRIRKEE